MECRKATRTFLGTILLVAVSTNQPERETLPLTEPERARVATHLRRCLVRARVVRVVLPALGLVAAGFIASSPANDGLGEQIAIWILAVALAGGFAWLVTREYAIGASRASEQLARGTKERLHSVIEAKGGAEGWLMLTIAGAVFQVRHDARRPREVGDPVVIEYLKGPPHAVLSVDGAEERSGSFFP